ncbi:putative heterokaryon incompatibility protein [Botrytis fragariae]|uniref:Putative heterokaryon incompatibility protein n=1 Tax=Botrytis fragariae TaxID=1964551 RepID=A0A8H6B2A8_9HELO|nr:putative heterokaryon incompatibility protein [Botrytis fragariae]KAF5877894.1 putative heterokaryon incompatibility protein [Botrytis fragariae]
MQSTFHKVIRERRKKLVEVSTLCAEKVYLELRVPEDAQSILEVVFRTISHDQGYSGEPQYHGTYKNSFTWFVASVATPGGQERVPRKVLYHNMHADETFRIHELCWRADDQDQIITEWINAIQRGDTIQIIPVAQYPAWINFVQEAEIEIHYILAPQNASTFGLPTLVSDTAGQDLYRSLEIKLREVRLVHLNPGLFEDPISCSITYMSLKECTESAYEALSYCWGDHRQRKDIKVTVTDLKGHSEYIMSITLSLYSALQRLRPQNGLARVLWADSICINQDDLAERSSQVSLMRDIYRKAQGVVVWLGHGTEPMHKSIMTLTTIENRYKPNESMDLPASELPYLHDPLMENVNGEKHSGMYNFVDEWTLYESPWFSRTWVVQEVFNARETTFYCGDNTLNLAMMMRVNKCISSLKDLKLNSSHKAIMPSIYDDLFHARFATGSSQSMQNGILEVLIKGLDLDATDPRDKIFAMLQFGKETQNLELLPLELVPDYRRSVSEVFSSFTKWWIVKHESLRILSAIHALDGRAWQTNKWETTHKYDADQPTWSWWFRGQSNWVVGILGLKTDNSYRASADTKPNISLISGSKQTSILTLAGFKIDFIESLIPYPYFSPPKNLESLHRAYVGIFDPLNLIGKWQHQLAPGNMSTYVFLDDTARIKAHYAAHQDFSVKNNAVECNDPSFFSTPGGLVGLCPSSARVGDIIVVLHGGPVPYVLRELLGPHCTIHQSAKRYEFIGECYLESYMDGRGVQDNEGVEPEIFSLI